MANCLGIGLTVARVPKTGELKQVKVFPEYVSNKAFTKGIRSCAHDPKIKFSYWLPLYFNYQKERSLFMGENALSFIYTGNTKNFNPDTILDFFPKALLQIGLDIIESKFSNCFNKFRFFFHIHTMFLIFLEKYPE